MKYTSLLAILLTFISCKNSQQQIETEPVMPDGKYCFEYNLSFDTIRVHMDVKDDNVTGDMHYIFFEKDNSQGSLNGKIEGNKIVAVYDAASSGGGYKTEIIFLVEDGELNVGFGEMEDRNGTLVYKDTSSMNYDTFTLRPSDCK